MGDWDEAGIDGCCINVLVRDVGVAKLCAGQADGGDTILVRDRLQGNTKSGSGAGTTGASADQSL